MSFELERWVTESAACYMLPTCIATERSDAMGLATPLLPHLGRLVGSTWLSAEMRHLLSKRAELLYLQVRVARLYPIA